MKKIEASELITEEFKKYIEKKSLAKRSELIKEMADSYMLKLIAEAEGRFITWEQIREEWEHRS